MVMVVGIRDKAGGAEIHMLRDNLDFNFPKMHILEYMLKHITSYGHLSQYSTSISERFNKVQIKEGRRKSNQVDIIV